MSEEISPLRKAPKKVLGRGLGSLLGEASSLESAEKVAQATVAAPVVQNAPSTPIIAKPTSDKARIWQIPIEKISPNREQPRRTFDQAHLIELANSIKEKGILLPIVVRQIADQKYEIVAGERRWRASQIAGLHDVPVIIRTAENQEALELALIENIQRQNLNPIEEAEAYQRLAEKYNMTQQLIADKVGKDRATIANLMRLVSLPNEVKVLLKSGELQLGQAKLLVSIPDKDKQIQLAKKIVQLRLSVRATEKLIATQAEKDADDSLDVDYNPAPAREAKVLAAELQKILGTKVEIDVNNQKSKVTIQFYSIKELNMFVDKLRNTTR
jgi:ParB family chromosome partitioning protein